MTNIRVLILFLIIALIMNAETISAQSGLKDIEREYYELDYKIREWDRIRQQSGKVVIPENFERDIARWNQLSAQLAVAKAKKAADIGAEENTKNVIVELIKHEKTTEYALSAIDKTLETLKAEQEFYKNWEREASLDTGIASTLYGQDRERFQRLKDEAVMRQRELRQQIDALKQKQDYLKNFKSSVKGILSAKEIHEAIEGGDFVSAATKTIDMGSDIAERVYDEKTFEDISGRLEAGKSFLDVGNKIYQGNYLDASITAANTVDRLLADYQKEYDKENKTLQLFMETDFVDKSLKDKALQIIDISNERKSKIENLVDFKKKVKYAGERLGKFKKYYGYYKMLTGEIAEYERIASMPGRSENTARLIYGMSKLGDAFNMIADAMPPMLKETLGQFLRFYSDALKLGESIDKIVREWFEKRDACLNIYGQNIHNSYALEVIEERWGRDDLCIRPAPEFKQSHLAMYFDDNLGKTYHLIKYFFIPSLSAEPLGLTQEEYSKIVKIASDYSAYASFVASSYRLTNEDLKDIITAVQSNRDSFTINDGYFRDTTFKISQLSKDVQALFHIKASIGDELSVSNHRNMIEYWYMFVDSTEFIERLCRFSLYDNNNIMHRMFVNYLKNRDLFEDFIIRQRLTNPSSLCKIEVSLSGDRETVVNKPASAVASIKNARDTFRHEWLNEADNAQLSSSESVKIMAAQEGTYRMRFNLYVKSGNTEMRLISLPYVVIVKPDPNKIECTYTYSDWGECNPLTKKQTRRVVSMLPKGCIEKDKPLLEQQCTPDVKESPVCSYQYSDWSPCDDKTKKQTRRIISKSPVNCIEKDKPMLEQSCTPATKTPPTCSYKYSEWGECSRATKKQTRSVVAREPAGCIEHSKPTLEQGCTPPPTEEEKRHQYFNCLCRCSSGWAGHIGVWYDPEGKSIPECKSSGPCFGGAGAFGCTRRHFFNAPNDCAKGCWEGAFGKDTYDADKADKIRREENKKHVKPITVKLKASKNPADIGDIIDVQAEASEGTGGYAYRWSGCISESKDASAKASFKNQCKTCAVAITVTDQDGNSASDSITLQCSPIKVKLTKESPKENNIPIGGKAAFFAEVFSGDKPFTGPTLKYLWERNPDAVFGDPKNPQYEQKAGSQARNTALFRNIGTTPVWVVVQREIDGRWATIGESEQIMINVVKPKIKLQLNKKEPFIGEKVVLTVHEEPKMSDDFITFWWEYSGNISNPGVEPNISNSRAYSFKPKDAKPVTVTVHAKAKDGGDDLGQAKITITPKSYSVAISEPRYLGPKPRIWKCDTQLGGACPGLVEVGDTQFAVFRDIFMKAIITPSPDSPRYRWTVDPSGSCGFPGSGSEIKINCSNTGTYTVKVEVANADGAKLGEAAQAVTVSISQEQLGGATKSKEAYDKVQQAKQLVVQGKLDEGITLAEEASRLDPKNTEAKSLSDKWKDDVKAIRKHIVTSEQLQKDNMLAEAERELQAARALHPKYPPLIVAENRLKAKKEEINKKKAEAQRLKTEGEALERQGNLQSAVNKYKESIRTLPDKTLEEHIRKLETQIAQNAQKKTASDRLWDECAALAKQGRNQEALQKCRESLNYWSDDKRRAAIVQLENAVKQEEQKKAAADRLWDECSALAKQNRLNEALSKCKESLNHWSSDKRISATKDLENTINQATQKKAISDRLWDECAALAKQGRNQEALQKCRESLNYWSSEKRVAVVKELENKVKQTTAIQPPIAPPVAPPTDSSYGGIQDAGSQFYLVDLTPYGGKKGSPRKAKNIEVDDGSWIRLKATHEKRLFLDITLPTPISASSIAIVSNLDNAHYVKDDVITTVLTVYTKSGSHRFEFKAGVHSSEWNRGETGGADHRFPKENHLGDKRWLAVFNLPQGSVVTGMRFDHRDTDKKFYHAGAAPGFCLRGITLIRSGITGGFTGSGNITSTEKQKGNVIFDNGNIGGVYNNPTKATVFTINQPHVITLIQNYHWNNAKGSTPGTIGVKSQSGKMYGPWQAKGSPGQGGVPNAYWTVYPNITLPAGTYTVIDSTPSTWAQNSGSNGAGFTRIEGYPVSGGGGQQSGNTIQQGRTITAEFVNSSPQNIHIFVEGQDTFGSHNRITPNERKRVNIKAPPQADFIKFNAGRNGQVLAACRWEYDPDNISGRIPVVTFNELNRLSCATGHR